MASIPHNNRITGPRTMRSSIHTASASRPIPNSALTASIQAPARGTNLPADTPNRINGTPIPMARENNAAPPSAALPEAPMTIKAAASGGATQGPTIRADRNPIMATPVRLPPRCSLLARVSLVCSLDGSCNSKKPNMDIARATNIAIKNPIIHGFWKTACKFLPNKTG